MMKHLLGLIQDLEERVGRLEHARIRHGLVSRQQAEALDFLGKRWAEHPDWRLGELIECMEEVAGSMYHVETKDLFSWLQRASLIGRI